MVKRKNEAATVEEADTDSFENCLKRLEDIVIEMENGQLSLEELVKQYEQGSSLLARCDSFLKSARERIELITLKAQSEIEDSDQKPDPSEDSNDDEIRLF